MYGLIEYAIIRQRALDLRTAERHWRHQLVDGVIPRRRTWVEQLARIYERLPERPRKRRAVRPQVIPVPTTVWYREDQAARPTQPPPAPPRSKRSIGL